MRSCPTLPGFQDALVVARRVGPTESVAESPKSLPFPVQPTVVTEGLPEVSGALIGASDARTDLMAIDLGATRSYWRRLGFLPLACCRNQNGLFHHAATAAAARSVGAETCATALPVPLSVPMPLPALVPPLLVPMLVPRLLPVQPATTDVAVAAGADPARSPSIMPSPP